MTIAIRLAETEAELTALYTFRYRIYVEEMARPQKYADHDARTIRDPLDDTAYNLVAWQDDAIAGCVRVNFARDGGMDYYERFSRMLNTGNAYLERYHCARD